MSNKSDIDNPILTALEKLRMRLLDLTARNRLLNFRHTKSALRIIDELPNQLTELLLAEKEMRFLPVPEPRKEELIRAGYIKIDEETGQEQRLKKNPNAEEWARWLGLETSYEVPPHTAGNNTTAKHTDNAIQTLFFPYELEARLRSLFQKSESAIKETGANILYLSFGFLEWFESPHSDKSRLSPLFLIPARLLKGRLNPSTKIYEYTLKYSGEDVFTNLSLREKLRVDFGLALPDLNESTLPEAYFKEVSALIRENQPRWKIRRYCTLALLNFSKLLMYLDLDPSRWPKERPITDHPIIKLFFGGIDGEGEKQHEGEGIGFGEEHSIDDIPDIHKNYPLIDDADSSQHSALIDALDGKNLVIEGPPGTGKSQTITNLIAAAIARGKKVLFVAEKLAALEVVKRNLDQAKLGDFCLELHSHKTQKRRVLDDIETRLTKHDQYRKPSDINADINRFESLKIQLKRHVELVNEPWKNTGKTNHEIMMCATRYREALHIDPMSLHPENLNGRTFDAAAQRLSRDQVVAFGSVYKSVSQQLDPESDLQNHAWFGVENTSLQLFDTEKVCLSLEKWQHSLQRLHVMHTSLAKALSCDERVIPFTVSSLENLNTDLLKLPALFGDEILSTLPNLKGETLEEFGRYLDLFMEIQALQSQLSKSVRQEVLNDLTLTIGLLENSRQLSALAGEEIELAVLTDSMQRMKQLEKPLQVLDKIRSKLGNVVGCFLRVHEVGLKEFKIFFDLVASLKPGNWKYRDDCFDQDELDELLPVLKRRIEALQKAEITLAQRYNLTRRLEIQELENIRYTLTDTSLFRWFKSEWRTARNHLLTYGVNKQVKPNTLLLSLDELIKFVREKSKLQKDQELSALLGKHFTGYDTKIDTLLEIRNWYQRIRKIYGVGFGQKVEIGNALIAMPPDLGKTIRYWVEKGINRQIDGFLKELSWLKRVFRPVESLQNGTSDLIGKEGVLGQIQDKLRIALKPCQGLMKGTNIPLKILSTQILRLYELKDKVDRWKALDCEYQIFNDPQRLDPSIGVHNEQALNAARHTEKLAKGIDCEVTSTLIKKCIYDRPETRTFESLKEMSQQLKQNLKTHEAAISEFRTVVGLKLEDWEIHCGENLDALIERNRNALENQSFLVSWLDYVPVRSHLSAMGFGHLITAVEKRDLEIEEIEDGYLAGIYDFLVREIFQERPELARFSGSSQEALQKQFRDYDVRLKKLQREKIAWQIDQNPVPRGFRGRLVSEYSEELLLIHVCGQKKPRTSIRELLNRAGQALIALKPCFMMGPMSVAQYLAPGELGFDLVVMDEASQVKPADALGAVARGGQLVVVGDPKQLPPSNFFDKMIDDQEEDQTAIEESESILKFASAVFPSRRLRWHYRSQHESLIRFSNYHFYGSDLVLFPSPYSKTDDYGIQFIKIDDGHFINERNIEEARVIAEAVREHFRNHPDETLGVVTMNAKQREQIERYLEEISKEDPLFQENRDKDQERHDALFIKNLENVQGDERDVIFISMTYGPREKGGRVMKRFSPINTDNGWRRLNVLFTRSKKRMHIFSSMSADDIDVGTSKRGVQVLKDFLHYAKTGILVGIGTDTGRAPDSDFEIAVIDVLQSEGFTCQPQVGADQFFIDIGVKDPGKPGRYLMGIECDGAMYHSAKSVRDRDRLRQSHLENLGWRIRRIWSTDWFKNPKGALQPIIRELHELKTVWPKEEEVVSEAEEISEIVEQDNKDEEKITPFISKEVDLKQRLLNFDEEVIRKEQPDTPLNRRLLRPAMLDVFLEYCPTSKSEFLENIPEYLRLEIAPSEEKYLTFVFDIIDKTIGKILDES